MRRGAGRPAVAVQALEGGYGESPVLHGVNLEVGAGEIFAILGKNGMGKTTLLKTIMGLLPARQGRVEFLGEDVTGWPAYRITRLGVSYVPQEKSIFQDLSVEENLRLALRDASTFGERLETVARVVPGPEGAAATAGGDALGRRAEDAPHRAGAPHPARVCPGGRDQRGPPAGDDHAAHGGPGGGAAGARARRSCSWSRTSASRWRWRTGTPS